MTSRRAGPGAGSGPGEAPAVPGFEIRGLLGRGGAGVVYRARRISSGGEVALKIVDGASSGFELAHPRFRREVEILSTLSHPNLVRLLEAGSFEGGLYLAMELVDGGSLEPMASGGGASLDVVLPLARQLAAGLGYLHARGVIHRDVKPSNILITRDGSARVADFGLARAHGQTLMTRPGAILGTPCYMAPEVLAGDEMTAAGDVWALGVVLYQLVAGRLPFDAGSLEALARAIVGSPAPRLRDGGIQVPEWFETILAACLEKNPGRRATMDDVGSSLESWWTSSGRGGSIAGGLPAGPPAPGLEPDFPLSERFRTRFELMEPLTGGGMSIIYRAIQRTLRREVVIKFLPDPADTELRARFQREALILKTALREPGVLPLLDYGHEGDRSYLVLPFVPGRDLHRVLHERRRLPWQEVHPIACRLASSLAAVHRHGIVHRDLKPSNVMISAEDGLPYLIDFGLGLAREQERLTEDRQGFQGTVIFASPEQLLGEEVDGRSDLYSLGATLHACLTGAPPHRETRLSDLISAKLNRRIASLDPEAVGAGCPMEPLILKLLERRPESRFAAAEDLLEALEAIDPANPAVWRRSSTRSPDRDGRRGREGGPLTERIPRSPAPRPGTPAGATGPSPAPDRPRTPWRSAVALVLGVLAAGSLLVFRVARGPEPVASSSTVPSVTSGGSPARRGASPDHGEPTRVEAQARAAVTRIVTLADPPAPGSRPDEARGRVLQALELLVQTAERLHAHRIGGEIWLELFLAGRGAVMGAARSGGFAPSSALRILVDRLRKLGSRRARDLDQMCFDRYLRAKIDCEEVRMPERVLGLAREDLGCAGALRFLDALRGPSPMRLHCRIMFLHDAVGPLHGIHRGEISEDLFWDAPAKDEASRLRSRIDEEILELAPGLLNLPVTDPWRTMSLRTLFRHAGRGLREAATRRRTSARDLALAARLVEESERSPDLATGEDLDPILAILERNGLRSPRGR